MKIEVEITEFWMEEDSDSIEKELKNFIINNVVNQINKKIEEKIENEIQRTVKAMIEKSIYDKMQIVIAENIKTIKIKSQYSGKEPLTLEEHIKEKFVNNSGWNSPNNVIEKIVKPFAIELKKRYDLLFATQIVTELDKNGLLKENIAKLLQERNGD